MEIREVNQGVASKLLDLLKTTSDNQYVQCPCKVLAVNGNYVDVLPIINDDMENVPIYDVKVHRKESSEAYIYFKIHVGDRGVLRFFDRSIETYSINGSEGYNEDDRMHDANDGCFELGFLPDNESYVYPTDQEIEIGLKNVKFKISVDENGNIDILSEGNVNLKITGNVTSEVVGNVVSTIKGNNTTNILGTSTITCPVTNYTGNINVEGIITTHGEVISNGVELSTHTHGGVTSGSGSTGKPN